MENLKLNSLLFLLFFCSLELINAQSNFIPGYVILNSKDTVNGLIDYRKDQSMSISCRFKDSNKKILELSPDEIIAYRFIDSRYYISKMIDEKRVFLEYLIKGKVDVFYMRDEKGDHYYIEKEGIGIRELPYKELRSVKDSEYHLYKSQRHKGLLSHYMEDAPELQSRIKSMKRPEHKNLIKIAKDYHNTVCDDYECVIYAKELPAFKLFPEIVVGTINYSNFEDLTDKVYFHSGIIGHIWLPRANERLYFRTGILSSKLDFDGQIERTIKIPFQLEYIYPKGIIRPRIAYGVNIYRPKNILSVSLNLGANINVYKNISISAITDFEFTGAGLILPKEFLSNSLQLGLFLSY